MANIITAKIDVRKLDKSRFFEGKPDKNGHRPLYADIVLLPRKEVGKFGDSELLRREVFWVNRLDSMNPKKGYNLVSPDRRIISAHTRAKMGLARRGVPLKTGHRNKIAEALTGNANALGHRHSEETRNKIRIAATGRASKLRGTKSPHTTKMLIARHAMRRAAYKKSAQFKVFKSFFYSGWSFQDIAYSFGRTTAWAWKVAKRYNLKREIA